LEETLAAVKNYTQRSEYIDDLRPQEFLPKVVEIANQKGDSKKRQYATAIVKNCSKNPSVMHYMNSLI